MIDFCVASQLNLIKTSIMQALEEPAVIRIQVPATAYDHFRCQMCHKLNGIFGACPAVGSQHYYCDHCFDEKFKKWKKKFIPCIVCKTPMNREKDGYTPLEEEESRSLAIAIAYCKKCRLLFPLSDRSTHYCLSVDEPEVIKRAFETHKAIDPKVHQRVLWERDYWQKMATEAVLKERKDNGQPVSVPDSDSSSLSSVSIPQEIPAYKKLQEMDSSQQTYFRQLGLQVKRSSLKTPNTCGKNMIRLKPKATTTVLKAEPLDNASTEPQIPASRGRSASSGGQICRRELTATASTAATAGRSPGTAERVPVTAGRRAKSLKTSKSV